MQLAKIFKRVLGFSSAAISVLAPSGCLENNVATSSSPPSSSSNISSVNKSLLTSPVTINAVSVSTLKGTTANVQLAACVAALPAGGTCDATGFGATTQTISATAVLGDGVHPFTFLFDPATTFVPATRTVDMFSIIGNSEVSGLTVNALSVSGYEGNAVKFVGSCLQGEICSLTRFTLINGTNGTNPKTGTGLLLSAASGVNALAFVDIEHGRIVGFENGILLTSTGPIGSNYFVNDNRFNDINVTNAVNCIVLSANPGDVLGNTFMNSSCEAGGGNILGATGVTLEGQTGSNIYSNMFNNFNIWDYGASVSQVSYSFNANTSNNSFFGSSPIGGSDSVSDLGKGNNISAFGAQTPPLVTGSIFGGVLSSWKLLPPSVGQNVFWIDNTNSHLRFSNGNGAGSNPVTIDSSGNLSAAGVLSATSLMTGAINGGVASSWKLLPPSAGQSIFWIDNTNSHLRFSSGNGVGSNPVAIDGSGNLSATGAISAMAGTNIVYRCVTAGTLAAGALTITPTDCGTTADTGLRVK